MDTRSRYNGLMGVKFTGNWGRPLNYERFNQCVQQALEDALISGEELGQRYISTRGITKPGRILTGDMLQSFTSVLLRTANGGVGTLGWIDDEPFYSLFQEYGTKYIEPMFALRDAAEAVKNQLIENCAACVKELR